MFLRAPRLACEKSDQRTPRQDKRPFQPLLGWRSQCGDAWVLREPPLDEGIVGRHTPPRLMLESFDSKGREVHRRCLLLDQIRNAARGDSAFRKAAALVAGRDDDAGMTA